MTTPSRERPCTARGRGEPGGAAVLLYHRVDARDGDSSAATDAQCLGVSAAHFAEHMEFLRRERIPLSLTQWCAAAERGGVPPRAVVVTFDDGYADNVGVAAPLLARAGVPATVFAATGYVATQRPFWWDAVESVLLRPGRLRDELGAVAPRAPDVALGWSADYDVESARAHRGWNVLCAGDPTPRQRAYRAWCDWLRALPPAQREAAVDGLLRLRHGPCTGDGRRPMTPDEIARLTSAGLVDVGAHTHWHPVLAALPPGDQAAEIARSRRLVEQWTGRPAAAFSYPYGTRHDYSAQTTALVRDAGFSCACANHAGPAADDADRFAVPRIVVRDGDADSLARAIRAATAPRRSGAD